MKRVSLSRIRRPKQPISKNVTNRKTWRVDTHNHKNRNKSVKQNKRVTNSKRLNSNRMSSKRLNSTTFRDKKTRRVNNTTRHKQSRRPTNTKKRVDHQNKHLITNKTRRVEKKTRHMKQSFHKTQSYAQNNMQNKTKNVRVKKPNLTKHRNQTPISSGHYKKQNIIHHTPKLDKSRTKPTFYSTVYKPEFSDRSFDHTIPSVTLVDQSGDSEENESNSKPILSISKHNSGTSGQETEKIAYVKKEHTIKTRKIDQIDNPLQTIIQKIQDTLTSENSQTIDDLVNSNGVESPFSYENLTLKDNFSDANLPSNNQVSVYNNQTHDAFSSTKHPLYEFSIPPPYTSVSNPYITIPPPPYQSSYTLQNPCNISEKHDTQTQEFMLRPIIETLARLENKLEKMNEVTLLQHQTQQSTQHIQMPSDPPVYVPSTSPKPSLLIQRPARSRPKFSSRIHKK
jgi:hypothetical protein